MKRKYNIFINLLKKHTDIDDDFIDTFFSNFKIGGEHEFEIDENDIASYLNIELRTLRKRLNNTFSKKQLYFENIDYIKKQTGKTKGVKYLVNYDCFERLAMGSDSEQGEVVRLYFSKLRKFITENQEAIYQALEQKASDLRLYSGIGAIYFFAADSRKFKIGKTNNIIERLQKYNTGRIPDVELKYLALVKNKDLIEKCMKTKLKPYQVIKNRKIYEIEPERIKKVIDVCYCKNVTKKENNELYNEIANLIGLHSYVNGKVHIKPFVVINS